MSEDKKSTQSMISIALLNRKKEHLLEEKLERVLRNLMRLLNAKCVVKTPTGDKYNNCPAVVKILNQSVNSLF